MKLDWRELWDKLYKSFDEGQSSWGKKQLMDHMDKLEKEAVRKEDSA